jgi:hypothetical protein
MVSWTGTVTLNACMLRYKLSIECYLCCGGAEGGQGSDVVDFAEGRGRWLALHGAGAVGVRWSGAAVIVKAVAGGGGAVVG